MGCARSPIRPSIEREMPGANAGVDIAARREATEIDATMIRYDL
jgi:hypothetical protein